MGVRGMTIRPTKIHQRVNRERTIGWGKDPISKKRERTRTGAGRLDDAKRLDEAEERLDAGGLAGHLHDDAVLADVDDPRAELVREDVQRLQILVPQAQRLARRERLCCARARALRYVPRRRL